MILLRSALFAGLFYGWTALACLFLLPLAPLGGRVARRVARIWARVSLSLARLALGLDYRLRGRENLPDGPCILACKHQSAWETIALAALIDGFTFVLKRELFDIPVFGSHLRRVGSIGIDRDAGASALKSMVRGARAALAAGQRVIIFPEGTRTAPGRSLPYLPGVAALYQLGVPVVPVALNSGLFWGRRRFLKYPGRVILEFLPPIAPGLDRKAFMETLEQRIETAANALSKDEVTCHCQ